MVSLVAPRTSRQCDVPQLIEMANHAPEPNPKRHIIHISQQKESLLRECSCSCLSLVVEPHTLKTEAPDKNAAKPLIKELHTPGSFPPRARPRE